MFRGGLLGFWVATVSYKLLLLDTRLLLSVTDLWEDKGFTTPGWRTYYCWWKVEKKRQVVSTFSVLLTTADMKSYYCQSK